jgi:predicted RNA-binding Zn ribbon-like protein
MSAHHQSDFEFSGGHLGLDFANTVSNRPTADRVDKIRSFRDLVAWGSEAGLLSRREAEGLRRLALEAPGRGKSTLLEAIEFREAVFSIFSAIATGRDVPANALSLLNIYLQTAAHYAHLIRSGRGFQWEWTSTEKRLDSVLFPVARAAAELLTSENLARLRICASDECEWLFLDTTKNGRRRWCDMKTCGNRDKARRFYERTKKA